VGCQKPVKEEEEEKDSINVSKMICKEMFLKTTQNSKEFISI
jgi:hypothetical protein